MAANKRVLYVGEFRLFVVELFKLSLFRCFRLTRSGACCNGGKSARARDTMHETAR